jgi:DNA repair protein RadD
LDISGIFRTFTIVNCKNLKLRENQVEPVKKGVEFFQQKKSVPSIIVAPTAFGKSIVIAEIAHQLGEKLLVIQPSKELLEQNYTKFINLGGQASIYSAAMGEKEIGEVTYATIGSIVNIAHKFNTLGIKKVIIDECDRFPREPGGMLRRFLSAAKITHVLGLTATPLKLQTNIDEHFRPFSKLVMLTSKSKKGNYFKEVIHVAQIKEMCDLGFWSPLQYESYDFDTGALVYNSTNAEFTDDSIKRAYKQQDIGGKIVKRISELKDRKSILVAVPSIEEAKELSTRLPSCEAIFSGMPDSDRNQIISDFKSGKLRIIVQVTILSVGFDHPELDCIITGRPTASLSWWYQFVGRVTRIHPDKENGLVIDFVGSVPKFGKVEDLYFKYEEPLWKLYGEDSKLLTGIPLHEIGLHKENQPSPHDVAAQGDVVQMTFGKYRGTEIRKIPIWYRKWMLENIKWTPFNNTIKVELDRLKNIGI